MKYQKQSYMHTLLPTIRSFTVKFNASIETFYVPKERVIEYARKSIYSTPLVSGKLLWPL